MKALVSGPGWPISKSPSGGNLQMTSSQKKWRAAVAALLLAVLPVAVVSASPAGGPLEEAGSIAGSLAEWVDGWAGGWLSRLLPGRAGAASETEPGEPPATVAPGDDDSLASTCDETTCTEGESLPDWLPDG
jgi:hypothetical protein